MLVPALLALVTNAVAVCMWTSKWWVTTLVLLALLCHVLTLHHTCKFILELSNVSNPNAYLNASLCDVNSAHDQTVVRHTVRDGQEAGQWRGLQERRERR